MDLCPGCSFFNTARSSAQCVAQYGRQYVRSCASLSSRRHSAYEPTVQLMVAESAVTPGSRRTWRQMW